MKRIVILLVVFVAVILVAKNWKVSDEKVASWVLENIEALANDEILSPARCLGAGDVILPLCLVSFRI